jgi:hypothetical protein
MHADDFSSLEEKIDVVKTNRDVQLCAESKVKENTRKFKIVFIPHHQNTGRETRT